MQLTILSFQITKKALIIVCNSSLRNENKINPAKGSGTILRKSVPLLVHLNILLHSKSSTRSAYQIARLRSQQY